MNYEIRRVDQECWRKGRSWFETWWLILREGRIIDTALSEERAWAQTLRNIESIASSHTRIAIQKTALNTLSSEIHINHPIGKIEKETPCDR